ncbi:MAG: hypothetical protein A2Y33_03920 [Spirochaetes bacterium GWF1_51_8]|nr:MAG: hypothetical protein A2Y33_03920 [Spirochaetes bacterium GWF1_51_8]
MKRYLVCVLMLSGLVSGGIIFAGEADKVFTYKSPYDALYADIDASASNMLIDSLYSEDLNIIYSALKRIGELKLKVAKINVKDVLGFSNPVVNSGKPGEQAKRMNIYHMSIWVLGRIGDDSDAEILSSYIKDSTDVQTWYYIIVALGEMAPAPKALEGLHTLTLLVKDERLAYAVVAAILKHNSKTSIIPLLKISDKSYFSPDFKKYVSQVMDQISKTGK